MRKVSFSLCFWAYAAAILVSSACDSGTKQSAAKFESSGVWQLDLPEAFATVPTAFTCSDCSVTLSAIEGSPALEVRTVSEFSDLFVSLDELLPPEHVDLTGPRYLYFDLLVPEGSSIAAMKFNVRDAAGNFGGMPEAANGFYSSAGQWLKLAADLENLRPLFKNWEGEDVPLGSTKDLSFNPYNTNQRDSATYYVRNLGVGDVLPKGYRMQFMPRPEQSENVPYRITFDDPDWLEQQQSYRTFEGSYQVIDVGVHGNPTAAIRIKGKASNRHIAFLPQIDRMTGQPADFTNVEAITFRYYLEPGGDPVDGAGLFLVSEAWENVLLDTLAIGSFEAGAWRDARIALDDLNLELVRGDADPADVLAAVHELRLDLNFREGQKDVEMWIDDFGWGVVR